MKKTCTPTQHARTHTTRSVGACAKHFVLEFCTLFLFKMNIVMGNVYVTVFVNPDLSAAAAARGNEGVNEQAQEQVQEQVQEQDHDIESESDPEPEQEVESDPEPEN
jgi:hypothetical protein